MLVSGIACGSDEWQLTTIVQGQGEISPDEGTFSDDTELTITAIPESGWDFDHWGGQASSTVNPITITMDSDKTIYAYFVEPKPTPIAGFQTYTDEDNGFSISFPEDWEVDPGGTWLFFSGSYCAGQPLLLGMNNLQNSPGNVQTYFYDYFLPIWSDVEGYTSISVEDITVDGVPALKHLYTDTGHGAIVQTVLVVMVKDYTAWEIMINISPDCWDLYENRLNTIINSFRFLD